MLAGTLLILECRTSAIRWNPTLDVNRVGMLFWLLMGTVHHFDIASSE
jgi:hypothetical protein